MFGNRLGWGIAGVLAVLMLWAVSLLNQLNTISRPSQGIVVVSQKVSLELPTHPELLDAIKLPADPLSVLPTMTQPGDAAPFYQRAIKAAADNRQAYEPSSKTGLLDSERLSDLPGVAALIDATRLSGMNLFAASPAGVINYDMPPAPIDNLFRVGAACNLLGVSNKANMEKAERENHHDQAAKFKADSIRYYEAAFSLGVKLVNERVRWPELDAGWDLMTTDAAGLSRVDPSRPAGKAFADACVPYYKDRLRPLWAVVGSVDPGIVGRTAGDVFYIVKHSRERMWRIEGILKLGRYRFEAGENGRGADQRFAGLWVNRIANDPKEDPIVREVARHAAALTPEELRMIH